MSNLEPHPASAPNVDDSLRRRRAAFRWTLFFGPGPGHLYLDAVRRAWFWALVPPLAYFALCVGIVNARSGYALLAPGIVLIVLSRLWGLLDVFRVPIRAPQSVSLLRVIAFALFANACSLAAVWYVAENVFRAYRIQAVAMEPTLGRDQILVSLSAFRGRLPRRGELAMFADPKVPRAMLERRVLALPGDHIELSDRVLKINDFPVPRCTVAEEISLLEGDKDSVLAHSHGVLELEFLGEAAYLVYFDPRLSFSNLKNDWTVGEGEVFALGDNRNRSYFTSLFENHGASLPLENLVGKPVFVWLALTPEHDVDWSRVNTRLDTPHLPKALASLEPALEACLRARPTNTSPPAPAH